MKTKNIAGVSSILANMTRKELRQTAKILHVPRGRSASDTRHNLYEAIKQGKAHVKLVSYIYDTNPTHPSMRGNNVIFMQKIRTYKHRYSWNMNVNPLK